MDRAVRPAGTLPRDMRSRLQGHRTSNLTARAVDGVAPPRETESRNACVPVASIHVGHWTTKVRRREHD